MAAYEILLLNTAIPQIQAAQSGDTYVVPRDIAFSTVAYLANGTNLLPSLTFSSNTNTGIYREGADALGFTAGGGTNLMVLTTTGLGIGTNNPAQKLSVQGSSTTYALAETTGTGTSSGFRMKAGASADYTLFTTQGVNQFAIYDNVAASERLTLSSSGNLGLGVTPSAWASDWSVMQIGSRSAFAQYNVNASAIVANNVYFAGAGGSNPTYIDTAAASFYQQVNGQHNWYNALSGTGGTGPISFTTAMTLDALGNLLVGKTSTTGIGTQNIEVNNSSSSTVAIKGGSNEWSMLVSSSSDSLRFYEDSTERARITSGGNLLVGCTSIRSTGWTTDNSQYAMETTGYGGAQWFTNRADDEGAYIVLGKSRGTTVNSNTIVNSGDTLGALVFQGTNGTGVNSAAQIRCKVDGTPGASNDMPGRLEFYTTPDGSGTMTERARITSGGYFKASNTGSYIGSTSLFHELVSDQDNNIVRMQNSNASPNGIDINFSGGAPDNNTAYFLQARDNASGGTTRCIIYSDGDLANHDGVYGTISDQKLKQDIVDAGSQWADIKAIRFRKYRMKSDVAVNPDAPALLGVVAQELEQVSPGLVDEHPDMETVEVTDEDGNVTQTQQPTGTTTKTVKSSILLMKAAVALQEAMARIEKLEAEVAALKGA